MAANLEACERLASEAAAAGADWIALPEFFTTGVAFDERLADAALAPDGAAFELMRELAVRHGATVGGSFLCREPDGDGVIAAGELTAGAAVCWELMRSQTARRLRGRVDVVTGGSCWWSVPPWPP